jgi:hypothetical protein
MTHKRVFSIGKSSIKRARIEARRSMFIEKAVDLIRVAAGNGNAGRKKLQRMFSEKLKLKVIETTQ